MQYCTAAGCSNIRSDGVSLFKFPSDPILREKWTREVRRTHDSAGAVYEAQRSVQQVLTEEPDSAIAYTMGIAERKSYKTYCYSHNIRKASTAYGDRTKQSVYTL